jgi:hypothetical protein
MTMNSIHAEHPHPAPEPHILLDIEGKEIPWDHDTITPEQIAHLGGWDPAQGVIEIDRDNIEHTLPPGQPIEVKPGHGYGRKVKWKRG